MFRPCIDLHEGRVKQIVGGTLDEGPGTLRTNFVSEQSAAYYADLYRRDGLTGGHVIMLGAGNEEEARRALSAYPGGLQIGGGIQLGNARDFLEAGASHVIVTSWIFHDGLIDQARLDALAAEVGRERLVLDLSCRRKDGKYFVMTDRWQRFTQTVLEPETFERLARSCSEFLVHAVDVEGLCEGVDEELVKRLGEWTSSPVTYAGGARSMQDLENVTRWGGGRIDLTIGSALDIFGGSGVKYAEVVAFNRRCRA